MSSIVRPLTPPWLLIICRYAASILATMAKDEAGPLNGTDCPILIEVAVTPGPWFCSAAAAALVPASSPTSTATIGAKPFGIRQRLTRRAGVGLMLFPPANVAI